MCILTKLIRIDIPYLTSTTKICNNCFVLGSLKMAFWKMAFERQYTNLFQIAGNVLALRCIRAGR